MPETVRALVLAGGGAKGSYQVGVWQALQELGWYPDIITGTSIGSLNGALLALGKDDTLLDMWSTISEGDILTLPSSEDSTEMRRYFEDIVREGGMDVTPLENMIDLMLDEDALRNAKIRFGLVTVEFHRGLRRRELSIDEIPQGKLKDYLLASAACFPAIRPREIDGKVYLDGAYRDNMPFELAIKMGATELICAYLDAPGVVRPNFTNVPTKIIESHWDLGEIFRFNTDSVNKNICLGYFDTLRTFEKVRGTAYAISNETTEIDIAKFRVRYDRLLLKATKYNHALALAEMTALGMFYAKDKPLAPLELAAQKAGVQPNEIYTLESLQKAFLDNYDSEKAKDYEALISTHNPALVAKASLHSESFVTALVFLALNTKL